MSRDRFAWGASPRLTAGAFIIVGAVVSLALNLPGHLSYDSVVQLAEGREGVYGGGHPPVMSWLLGVGDALEPGASLFVVFDTVLIACALLSFVLLGRGVWWVTPLIAGACAASPQLLIYPGIVWKDVLFAASATAGFACLTYAALWWARRSARYALLVAGLLLLTLAALARQNGAVILPFAAAALGWIAAGSEVQGNRVGRRGWVLGLAFLVAAALIAAGALAALRTRSEGEPVLRGQWAGLQTYDIVSAIFLEPNLDLTVLRTRAPEIETVFRTKGVAAYSPVRADTLEPVFGALGRVDSADLIAAQWNDILLHHPLLYLRVRAKAFEWVILTPSVEDCVLVYTGVDGPEEEMHSLGLVRRDTGLDEALAAYALKLTSTPVYSHAFYGALGLVLLVALLRRRRPPDIVVAAMLGSAMAFAMTFAVISIACDYRYVYDLDIAVIAATLYVTATWGFGRGRGQGPRGPQPQ